MSVSNEDLLKSVRHYQESLEKYTPLKNNYKLLDIIKKLKRLPIATSHLEDTGIGRTVNALRKLGGEVGDAAKSLVSRWKEMVLEEEEKAKREAQEESVNTASSTDNDIDNYESSEEMVVDIKDIEQSKSSHKSSDTDKKSSDKQRKEADRHSSSNKKSSDKGDRSREKASSSKKPRHEYTSDNDERSAKKRNVSTSTESDGDVEEETRNKTSHRRYESDSSDDEDRKHKLKKSKHKSDDSSSDEKEHRKTSSSSKSHSSSPSKSGEKTDFKRHQDQESQRKDEKSKSKHRLESKSKRDSDCEEATSSKHKSKKDAKSESEETKKNKHESKSRYEKESKKESKSESKSHSSRSEKHEPSKKESKSSESHGHKRDEAKKSEEKHKKSQSSRKDKGSSSGASKLEENGKSSSGSKHKSGQDRKKEKEKVKIAGNEKIVNGIDSGSGASFADALGMCEPPRSSKSSVTKKKKSSSAPSEKPRASSSYSKSEQYEEEDEDIVPNLLKQEPPEPLNLNISSLLPEISPHYKPLGLPLDSQPRRLLTPDEALSQAISNKNMRTKVYSGNKTYGKLESLFDLCVRVLQDNIDALEYTGGVPYIILKPVLERATPDQLFNMEHHNPYLIEDTDELWQLHCQKEFRTKKREELESWREMYMRCLDEREARLNAITANIKQSQDKSLPVRTTKLAYVDSVVKPPRNVLRKQAKNGILMDKRPAQTPASRLSALATAGEAGKVAVPNPGSRAVDRTSSGSSTAAALKPKKAPLMAKTLSLFKNRFRR